MQNIFAAKSNQNPFLSKVCRRQSNSLKGKEYSSFTNNKSFLKEKKAIDNKIESLVNEGVLTLTYVDIGKE